jgi:hypothetical protein
VVLLVPERCSIEIDALVGKCAAEEGDLFLLALKFIKIDNFLSSENLKL